jgi:hypothetical protein
MAPAIELDALGSRLRAAVAAVLVRDNAPEVRLVRKWPDNWSGIGSSSPAWPTRAGTCS